MELINDVTYPKFRAFLSENGIKNKIVAELIGVTETTFSKKLNRRDNQDFTKSQIKIICEEYNLDANIFIF